MSRVTRGTPAGDAYLDLQKQARRTGRPTDELLQLYVLEGFLARLAESRVRESFVLKGGVLLAAFDTRRPTRDVDVAGLRMNNNADAVLERVRSVLAVNPDEDDGLELDGQTATAEVIREEDEYAGVRVRVDARLASAKLRFHVDVNVGDPIWPEPTTITLPRLRGGPAIEIFGYPMHMVHAEKIVTAVQRGVANTRWRDFADVWTLSGQHTIDGSDLLEALRQVAEHRQAVLEPLRDVLDGYADLAQGRWAAWRRRNALDGLPEQLDDVLEAVIAFADPVLSGAIDGRSWAPEGREWQ